ncbi:hypothetical protein RLOC_00011970 [Lonchura striata]|uniref:Secreted protein n=1 Tax=Lonchura striata TaxID=40157 RepID=A0A218VDP1_9PASE|nr:hypothetical protein RLOC_00011970 [Lonchura striata domestica]
MKIRTILFYLLILFTVMGRIPIGFAEVRHCNTSCLRSRSEGLPCFCQSENRQGWDLRSHEEDSQTPSSGHTHHQKPGPRNQKNRQVRIMGSKQVQTKGCFFTFLKEHLCQDLNFRCTFIFTSTALTKVWIVTGGRNCLHL